MLVYDLAGADEARRWSPFCWRVKLALAHKQLPFDTVPWHYFQKPELELMGSQTVPVLLDGPRRINDSWAIAEYLDAHYLNSPPLFRSDDARSFAKFVKQWVETEVHSCLRPLTVFAMYSQLDPRDQAYFRHSREEMFGTKLEEISTGDPEGERALFRRSLAPARRQLSEHGFLGGGAPGFADHILLGAILWGCIACTEDLLSQDDPLRRWRDSLLSRYGFAVPY